MKSNKAHLSLFFLTVTTFAQEQNDLPKNTAGQIIPRKGVWQLQISYDMLHGKKRLIEFFETDISYGFANRFAFELQIRVFPKLKFNALESSGLGDTRFFLDWTAYAHETMLVILSPGIELPTKSPKKELPTGTGSFNPIAKIRFLNSSPSWYTESSARFVMRTRRKDNHFGNQYGFDLMTGPIITTQNKTPSTFYALGLLSMLYEGRPIISNVLRNFGGTLVFLGPLFAVTRKNINIQATAQLPLSQRFFGRVNKYDYRVGGQVLISF